MVVTGPQPKIATNRDGDRVADRVSGYLGGLRAQWVNPPSVSIATAYFNPGGFALLADELEAAGRVRLLLGAEPHPEPVPSRRLADDIRPSVAAKKALAERIKSHTTGLALDRDQIGFSRSASATAQRLIAWLGSDRVEVRRLTDRFLHGKTFIVDEQNAGAMVGSSNFTYAGLAHNLELNLFTYDPASKSEVADWYQELWDAAEPFDLAGFYAERFNEHSPTTVYLRMLWEQYGDEFERQAQVQDGFLDLPEFSRDAVLRARFHLANRNGVLLADDVGLGKTFQAGELIARAVKEERARALVIAPAVLRDGTWRKFLLEHQLAVEVISFEELSQDVRLNPDTGTRHVLQFAPNDYSMIVIDEAHNLRNPSTLRADSLRALLAGSPPKDVVLLSATPVNNSLWDLYHLLKYFVRSDSSFADVGVPDLRDYFAAAMEIDPEDLTAAALSNVLDQVSVRRTRPFIKRYYPNATINVGGRLVPVVFPAARVVQTRYDFSGAAPGLINDLEAALDGYTFEWGVPPPEGVLAMARYSPSMYHLDRAAVDATEVQLAGLLRSLLLKRFESSPVAFARTARRMAGSHQGLIDLIRDQGLVASGRSLAEWVDTEGDDEEIEAWLEKYSDEFQEATDFDVTSLCDDLETDQAILTDFADRAELISRSDDPKLKVLTDELAAIAAEAAREGVGEQDTRNKRKVLLFSYFADTVDWIHEHLIDVCDPESPRHLPELAVFHGRIATVSGGTDKSAVLFGFCPETTDAPAGHDDQFDIVVCTDVLAEGVNLQQARHVINYDLPWNPQRLTQRHGRIDRLLSPHSEVFIRCFFPRQDGDLDRLLQLEHRLRGKMNQAVKIFGGTNVITGEQLDIAYAHTREEIAKLLEDNPDLFNPEEARALGGEEFRQQLRQVMGNPSQLAEIQALPWGSGSGFLRQGGTPGWVFCARVADHPSPIFRFIQSDSANGDPVAPEPSTGPSPSQSALACLTVAQPFPTDIERTVPDEMISNVFDAWDFARTSIVEAWQFQTDPANLTPAVPKAMRDADELVRSNPGGLLTDNEIRDLSARLLSNYSPRIWRPFRRALNEGTPPSQLAAIRQLVDQYSLTAPTPPTPLAPITADDVHLVCWMSVAAN